MKHILLKALLLTSALPSISFAQSVVRGPYLQSNTHESIKVMWRTNVASSSKVWYGTDPNNLDRVATINDNVSNHIVPLSGLRPLTKYYYKIGTANGEIDNDINVQHFTTHPIPGTPTPTRIWATGDFGRGNQGQVETKQAFKNYTGERGADVWIWLGDNAYQDGSDNEYQQKVFAVDGFSDIFTYTPFYPSPGNHDYNTVWRESTTLGIPYQNIPLENHHGPYFEIVEVPRYAEAGGFPSHLEVFYSFDYGDVHFLSLNSEVFDFTFSYDGINRMKQWIENDLRQNTRKFTIAYFHQPPYSKGSHDSDDAYELVMKAMREKVIPLLESYDVDLVVCGHSHVFERSYLLKGHYGKTGDFNESMKLQGGSNGNFDQGVPYLKDGSNATPEGTVYVVCGNSGSSEGSPSMDHPAMFFGHGNSNAMGSFIIDVDRNRLDGKYLTKEGDILDQFTILKKDLVPLPASTINICQGESVTIPARFTGGSNQISYLWSDNSIDSLGTFSPAETTVVSLTITDQITGQVEQVDHTINVISFPEPIITQPLNGVLAAPSGVGFTYQWYINGNIISGATHQYYQASFNGVYAVKITNPATGCNAMSAPFQFPADLAVSSIEQSSIQLFPNPTADKITIELPEEINAMDYAIMDLNGKVISQGNALTSSTTLSVKHLQAGMYFIQIKSDLGTTMLSFSKK